MLGDTEVVCHKNGSIPDLKKTVEGLHVSQGYDTITLVVGNNDCVSDRPKTPEEIVNLYTELIDSTEECQRVTISSMPPRLPEEQDCWQTVMSWKMLTLLIQHQFLINDGYLRGDGTSITKPAMNKLAKKLNLRIKNRNKVFV